jgi:hypothetical protein
MRGHKLVTVLVALGAAAVILLTAPLWAPRLALGAGPLPPRGARVAIARGYGINVLDEGVGPPVVLVHGLPGSAYDWRPLPEQLVAAGFRVIRYDRVGYGHSDRRTEGERHSIERNAGELLELLPALGGWNRPCSWAGPTAEVWRCTLRRQRQSGFAVSCSLDRSGHRHGLTQLRRLRRF